MDIEPILFYLKDLNVSSKLNFILMPLKCAVYFVRSATNALCEGRFSLLLDDQFYFNSCDTSHIHKTKTNSLAMLKDK